jgi:hypothetical protein
MFKNNERVYPLIAKARSKVSRLSEHDRLAWVDVAGAGVARSLSEYQKTGDKVFLTDAHDGAQQILGVIESML